MRLAWRCAACAQVSYLATVCSSCGVHGALMDPTLPPVDWRSTAIKAAKRGRDSAAAAGEATSSGAAVLARTPVPTLAWVDAQRETCSLRAIEHIRSIVSKSQVSISLRLQRRRGAACFYMLLRDCITPHG